VPAAAGPPVRPPVSIPPPAGRRAAPPDPAPAGSNGRAGTGGRRSARHQADGHPAASSGRATPPPTGGVYRHTETVQVTTRSTYVDEHGSNGSGGRYDGGYGGRDWSAPVPRSRSEPYEESWTDQKLRERYGGRRSQPYDRGDEDASGEQPWTRDSAPWRPVSATPVSEPGAGRSEHWRHRWDGDSPSELRLGERRAAARHSDQDGTELRLEERWASVRRDGRDDNGFGRPGHRDRDPDESGYGGPDYSRPALPSTSSEPSWNDSWDEPVRESRGHRYRPEFELSDERWR